MFEDLNNYVYNTIRTEYLVVNELRPMIKLFLSRSSLGNWTAQRATRNPNNTTNKNVLCRTVFCLCLEDAFFNAYEQEIPRAKICF